MASSLHPVLSHLGSPNGAVLGHILFLAYINDLPEQVKSQVRLFANDTVIYITCTLDDKGRQSMLQEDLRGLAHWETRGIWNSFKLSV